MQHFKAFIACHGAGRHAQELKVVQHVRFDTGKAGFRRAQTVGFNGKGDIFCFDKPVVSLCKLVFQHMDVKERNKGLAKKRKLLSESEKRITELDMIFKRLYEDNISGKLTDERFHKLSTDYEAEQAGLQAQAAILREEIEEAEGKSANVDRFLSVVRQYTDIPELTPRILHEFVEKIVIHAATDPHSKINRRQEVDIYYKGIGILEMSKVFDSRQK